MTQTDRVQTRTPPFRRPWLVFLWMALVSALSVTAPARAFLGHLTRH
jgi:hypothetical protein